MNARSGYDPVMVARGVGTARKDHPAGRRVGGRNQSGRHEHSVQSPSRGLDPLQCAFQQQGSIGVSPRRCSGGETWDAAAGRLSPKSILREGRSRGGDDDSLETVDTFSLDMLDASTRDVSASGRSQRRVRWGPTVKSPSAKGAACHAFPAYFRGLVAGLTRNVSNLDACARRLGHRLCAGGELGGMNRWACGHCSGDSATGEDRRGDDFVVHDDRRRLHVGADESGNRREENAGSVDLALRETRDAVAASRRAAEETRECLEVSRGLVDEFRKEAAEAMLHHYAAANCGGEEGVEGCGGRAGPVRASLPRQSENVRAGCGHALPSAERGPSSAAPVQSPRATGTATQTHSPISQKKRGGAKTDSSQPRFFVDASPAHSLQRSLRTALRSQAPVSLRKKDKRNVTFATQRQSTTPTEGQHRAPARKKGARSGVRASRPPPPPPFQKRKTGLGRLVVVGIKAPLAYATHGLKLSHLVNRHHRPRRVLVLTGGGGGSASARPHGRAGRS